MIIVIPTFAKPRTTPGTSPASSSLPSFAARKESEPLVVICSSAKCVPPDKPASRKTDGHAAGAAVFAELINVRAPGGGLCAAACPSANQGDMIARRRDRCRAYGDTKVIGRFRRHRSAILGAQAALLASQIAGPLAVRVTPRESALPPLCADHRQVQHKMRTSNRCPASMSRPIPSDCGAYAVTEPHPNLQLLTKLS